MIINCFADSISGSISAVVVTLAGDGVGVVTLAGVGVGVVIHIPCITSNFCITSHFLPKFRPILGRNSHFVAKNDTIFPLRGDYCNISSFVEMRIAGGAGGGACFYLYILLSFRKLL